MRYLRCILFLHVLMFIVQEAAFARAADETTVVRSTEPVRVNLRITDERNQWYVGDEIPVDATVTNISDRELFLPDWDEPSLKYSPVWRFAAEVTGIPGKTRNWTSSYMWGCSGGPDRLQWEPLDIGRTSRAKRDRFVAMIPGKMTIRATFDCRFLTAKRMTDKGLKRFYPYGRMLWITESVSLDIPATRSPAMTEKYERLSKTMLGDEVPIEERLAVLGRVAGEKHYFAARLVWDIWKQTQDPELKHAALLHLIDLLAFGTAYEAMPNLLEALASEATPLDARKRMLDVMVEMEFHNEQSGLRIADVAGYRFPEAVHEQARAVIGRLADSTDAALAEKAKALLEPDFAAILKKKGKERLDRESAQQ